VTHASSSNSFTLFLPLCPAPPPPFLDDIVQERDAWSRRPAASPSTTARARGGRGGGVPRAAATPSRRGRPQLHD
jgi:hypothetical protein